MWLVLCEPEDKAAMWAYTSLKERGLAPIELVAPRSLTRSERSAHRVEKDGASFEIGLPDGRALASGDIDGVLNRLAYAPVEHLVFTSRADTLYAMEEMSALVLSWLECIAPITVNRPSARGLSGAWRSAAEWTVLAARAGLPVAPLPLSSSLPAGPHGDATATTTARTVVVLGERVFGAEPVRALVPACRRLAKLAGTDLLGIDLETDARDAARFAAATTLPDLRIGGDALVDRLHEHLTHLPARSR
ncbi:hypothetical protein ACFRR6_04435 [Streptomyces sp. NPDC056891]|uniref:hypothetical protein n=1 Tax=Streptomyces sp. NPDC056891 TaxID=3345961 RepID=UPI003699BA74